MTFIKRLSKYLKNNYKLCWRFLKQTKNYIFLTCSIFLVVSLIGFFFPVFYKQEIIGYFLSLTKQIENFSFFQIFIFILWNNLKSAFIILFLGFVFGIFPLFALISNGYLLGFAANRAFVKDGIFSLWKIFPHGIFELPAILISIAIGMNLGFNVFNKKFRFKEYFFQAFKFFILVIIPLLVIAAVIEGSLIYFLN